MVKVCASCLSTWAGGMICEDCGGPLTDPFGDGAAELPEHVWSYIRLQYGARRGMIVRVFAYLLGPVVGFWLLRRALTLAGVWRVLGVVGAALAGLLTWWILYWGAGKAVRVWVLRRGQVHKAKLAKALLKRALPK